ncbi:deoxyribonuclease I [Culex quinquefasciatus]|uniref:Deoxyribonuclease I n=2 Tax=Culex quinquefasciatus TaxID=7176 RepID=B0W1N0_CULQU|nr:deoxyribonuclease I [Culex quinquefasciatus]|eukprot:XP_001842614.1 deoxyribonuclease I [Culex quinquefasciatus]
MNTTVLTSVLLVLIGGTYFVTANAVERNCVLPLKPDWSFFSPLIFSQDGTLISTENVSDETEDITLAVGDEVLLSCSPNYFREFSSEKVLKAKCKKDKTLVVNGMDKNFVSELSCEVRSIEEIIVPVRGCPNNARSIEYGYTNPVNEKSYILGEACYDVKRGQTLFVHTKIKSGTNTVDALALRTVNNVSYFRQEHPTSRYKIEMNKALNINDQAERFKAVFGTKNVPKIEARRYINEDLLTHKQYQSVLKLAWNYQIMKDLDALDNFDYLVTDITDLDAKEIEIYTGAHGVLSLKDKNDNNVDVYLKENRFPVPKFHWTVVRSGNKAVAFAIVNKPQLSDKEREKDAFCTSICDQLTWISTLKENDSYSNPRFGYVLCCELNDFRKTIKEMPPLTGISEVLK